MRMGQNSKVMWSTLKDNYADILRLRADAMNISNTVLGEKITERRDIISLFYNKKYFSGELLKKVCRVLDYPMMDLMTPEGKERYLDATRDITGIEGVAGASQNQGHSQ